MRFVLQMAWRDSQASRRRLLLFSLCVVFGIAALVALDSLTVSLGRAIADESKALLGADLVITSRTPFSPALEKYAGGLGADEALRVTFSSMMVFGPGKTRMVQVRAQDGEYPFYGEIVTEPVGAVAALRRAQQTGERVVVLEETLLAQFQLKVGDRVRLGKANFRLAGALKKISGESMAVTLLAPRALIPRAALAGAGLDENGPLVRRELALRLPSGTDADAVVAALKARFANDRLGYETVAGRRRELGQALTNVDGFLSLVGFIALLLGGIGVASAVHAHVSRKIPTVAVLRCLGVSGTQAFAIYVVQGCALGFFGAICGGALGVAIQAALPAIIGEMLPVPLHFTLSIWAVGRGMGAGFVICVLFTLLPLLGIRNVSPLEALRGGTRPLGAPGKPQALLLLIITAVVTAFAIWQTHSRRTGIGFTLAVVAAVLVFTLLAKLLALAARHWTPKRLSYVTRQGLANLHRPQNRTVLLLVSLGLGTFLFFTLFLTRTAFLRQLNVTGAGDRPNLMFFDIQDDQIGPLKQFLQSRAQPAAQEAAVVTMKIAAVRGRSAAELMKDETKDRLPGWTVRREYRSTYRSGLTDTEKLVEGKFVGKGPNAAELAAGAPVPISVEQGLAEEMRLKVGDTIDWDVQGVALHSQVSSIRTVDWRRLAPNFFVVFPAGVLEGAPKFHVVALRVPGPDASAALQAAVVEKFPNVTAIDLNVILQTLDGIFSKVTFVVEFMAFFTAATAVLVLACTIVAGRQQRRSEAVLLRTLGASGRQLARIQAVEYAVLGALAAAVGCILGWAASAALAHWIFKLEPAAPPLAFVAAVGTVVAATLGIGWFADRDLPKLPPLEILRAG
jgi:putative ABC transport system permease protein